MPTRARLGLRHAAAAAAFVALAVFGCQAIIGGDPPAFTCASADPSACPDGMTCDLGAGRCVGATDAGDEETTDLPDADASAVLRDARADQDAGPARMGTPCRVDGDCASKLCGTSAMLTPAITQSDGPLCTKPCCTSADCDTGFVCFGAGTGGNYCVPPQKLSRAAPGAKSPGASCATNGECRSGRCEGSRCLDTCCSNANCAAPTTCRLATVNAGVARESWNCALPPGPLDAGQSCTDQAQCSSNACLPSVGACRTSCCGKASCEAAGFAGSACIYGLSVATNDRFKFCGNFGGAAAGQPCQTDPQCKSQVCDTELRTCIEPCCLDSDCLANQACRPAATGNPFLRCIAR
jgi:hypothetical protein